MLKERNGRTTNILILLKNLKHENYMRGHFLNAHKTSVNLIQVPVMSTCKHSNKQKNINKNNHSFILMMESNADYYRAYVNHIYSHIIYN